MADKQKYIPNDSQLIEPTTKMGAYVQRHILVKNLDGDLFNKEIKTHTIRWHWKTKDSSARCLEKSANKKQNSRHGKPKHFIVPINK